MEPLKIFFYCNGKSIGTLVSLVIPIKGHKVKVTNSHTAGTYLVQSIEWELENGMGEGVVNITVALIS